jgi:hypothetical protein
MRHFYADDSTQDERVEQGLSKPTHRETVRVHLSPSAARAMLRKLATHIDTHAGRDVIFSFDVSGDLEDEGT